MSIKIGFEAKRAFCNRRGLGNYSRSLISALESDFSENKYVLYSPVGANDLFTPKAAQVRTPQNLSKFFRSIWRRRGMTGDIRKDELNIFHGLSAELPEGIEKLNLKKIVSIHDLIWMKRPDLFSWIDQLIYSYKAGKAVENADKIFAMSEQTKNDIIDVFKIPESKIEVTYQSCRPEFYLMQSDECKLNLKLKYKLPKEFIICVGALEERKNGLLILRALHKQKKDQRVPIVFVGRGKVYRKKLIEFALNHKVEQSLIILDDVPDEDVPGLVQMARCLVYPSQYEGFGIPILEGFFSHTPVITSNDSCLREVGGDGAKYIDPADPEQLRLTLEEVLGSTETSQEMVQLGDEISQNFHISKTTQRVVDLYKSLL